jgi:AraC-like DNA-binding protein
MAKSPGGRDGQSASRPRASDSDERVYTTAGLSKLLDDFNYCFGIRILFFSPKGRILRVGSNLPDSPFCSVIRTTCGGEERCLAQDRRMRTEAAERREILAYSCYAGLRECVYPIFGRGAHLLGFAMIGQYRLRKTVPSDFFAKRKSASENRKRLEEYFQELPLFSSEAEGHMINIFKYLADYAVLNALVSMESNLLVDKIISWVEEHTARKILSVDEAAASVQKSAATVSRILRRETGMSFRRLVVEKKLEAAEDMLIADPDSSIGEIAEALGFSDQFFFSRQFKKYRGVSPTEYIKRHRF